MVIDSVLVIDPFAILSVFFILAIIILVLVVFRYVVIPIFYVTVKRAVKAAIREEEQERQSSKH